MVEKISDRKLYQATPTNNYRQAFVPNAVDALVSMAGL
ncbi:MAG: hypothetical protein QOE73_2239 [Verrucomicrobiota bacterium]